MDISRLLASESPPPTSSAQASPTRETAGPEGRSKRPRLTSDAAEHLRTRATASPEPRAAAAMPRMRSPWPNPSSTGSAGPSRMPALAARDTANVTSVASTMAWPPSPAAPAFGRIATTDHIRQAVPGPYATDDEHIAALLDARERLPNPNEWFAPLMADAIGVDRQRMKAAMAARQAARMPRPVSPRALPQGSERPSQLPAGFGPVRPAQPVTVSKAKPAPMNRRMKKDANAAAKAALRQKVDAINLHLAGRTFARPRAHFEAIVHLRDELIEKNALPNPDDFAVDAMALAAKLPPGQAALILEMMEPDSDDTMTVRDRLAATGPQGKRKESARAKAVRAVGWNNELGAAGRPQFKESTLRKATGEMRLPPSQTVVDVSTLPDVDDLKRHLHDTAPQRGRDAPTSQYNRALDWNEARDIEARWSHGALEQFCHVGSSTAINLRARRRFLQLPLSKDIVAYAAETAPDSKKERDSDWARARRCLDHNAGWDPAHVGKVFNLSEREQTLMAYFRRSPSPDTLEIQGFLAGKQDEFALDRAADRYTLAWQWNREANKGFRPESLQKGANISPEALRVQLATAAKSIDKRMATELSDSEPRTDDEQDDDV